MKKNIETTPLTTSAPEAKNVAPSSVRPASDLSVADPVDRAVCDRKAELALGWRVRAERLSLLRTLLAGA